MSSFQVSKMLSKAMYSYQDRCKSQIVEAIDFYRGLKPILENVTLPTGIKRDLICLKGTIPVSYRHNTYHIPICIWVLNNHPESAPICWVNPTKDMTIKISNHVDQNGRVFLPYLADWNSSSDLLGVIQVMIMVFGETSPLYSKPKTSAVEISAASSAATNNVAANANPPYPNHPYTFAGVYPPLTPVTSQTTPQMASNLQYPFSSYSALNPPYAAPKMTNSNTSADTISKEHIRLSLLSAIDDKLRARARDVISQYKDEISVLKQTGNDLDKGKIKLENLVSSMESSIFELTDMQKLLDKKNDKLSEHLKKMESSKENINIDEHFGPDKPLYKQLLNAFVEENAIIDTIFYLNEALQKNVIDLDVFMKHCRELSRRQFMMRALIKLCREKAKLPT